MIAKKPFPIAFLRVSRTVAPPHRRRAGQLQLLISALLEETIIDYKKQVPMSLVKTNKFRADSVSRSMTEFFRIAEGSAMTCRARDGVVRCEALLFVAMRTHTTQYNTTINKNSVNAIKAGIDWRVTKISTTNMNNTQLTQRTNNQPDGHKRYVSSKMLRSRTPHKSSLAHPSRIIYSFVCL